MKFKAFTKKPKVKKETKSSNKHHFKKPTHIIASNGLSTTISEKYEGKVEGIVAYIQSLPKDIQTFITTNKVLKTVSRQGYNMYVLEGKITIKISEVLFDNKNKIKLEIKEGKKHILNTYL